MRRMHAVSGALSPLLVLGLLPAPRLGPGPLRVCPANPRYFAHADGRPVYLTGIHTWNNFKDIGPQDPPPRFDYSAYLDLMVRLGHNFIRLWTWDLTCYTYGEQLMYAQPFPWQRTGPGRAKDGKPKFDLTRYDPSYFRRLRQRVEEAARRGLYVSIMLFEGHGTQRSREPWCWDGHPFNPANNINGINGDPNGDGRGLEVYTLQVPEITRVQEEYVRRVVRAVNDLDNVLYEICNEAGPYSTEWQFHMIRFVRECERRLGKVHPVGMTFQFKGGSNETLFESPADWISPNRQGGYRDSPPPADGRKVIINDTDHLWGIGGNVQWAWKSFMRGLNPIFMDPYRRMVFGREPGELDRRCDGIRRALGQTRRLALLLNLAQVKPMPGLASTRYCLAWPGRQYLVYLPDGGSAEVDLSAARGRMKLRWFDPQRDRFVDGGFVEGGSRRKIEAPFGGMALALIFAP